MGSNSARLHHLRCILEPPGVFVLGYLQVLPKECSMDRSAHCFRSLRLNVIQLESTGKALDSRQERLRHRPSVLHDTPSCTHPRYLFDPTFRGQSIHDLPLTSNNGDGMVLAPASRVHGPRRRVVAPVSASDDIFQVHHLRPAQVDAGVSPIVVGQRMGMAGRKEARNVTGGQWLGVGVKRETRKETRQGSPIRRPPRMEIVLPNAEVPHTSLD